MDCEPNAQRTQYYNQKKQKQVLGSGGQGKESTEKHKRWVWYGAKAQEEGLWEMVRGTLKMNTG